MTCKELVELITEYHEGALSAPDRLRFEEHVDRCPPCRTYVEQIQQAIQAVGRLNEASLSPDVRNQLLEAFRTWKKS